MFISGMRGKYIEIPVSDSIVSYIGEETDNTIFSSLSLVRNLRRNNRLITIVGKTEVG